MRNAREMQKKGKYEARSVCGSSLLSSRFGFSSFFCVDGGSLHIVVVVCCLLEHRRATSDGTEAAEDWES